ncbi:MAG: riboflavin synthase, partial [Burkholderiales bacterium]|nr:riboflavin synthase [Burkholderiales bacterium]
LGHEPQAGKRLVIAAPGLDLSSVKLGDSIALNGACMTVVEKTHDTFSVDVSAESLSKTAGLDQVGTELNLEKALCVGDALGGHLVSGHVDGQGTVQAFSAVGESWQLVLRAPRELGKYLAYKGSVTVNGVSLTVNRVEDHEAGCDFYINLIPHTVQVTTLKQLQPGMKVNLEIDLIARYAERLMSAP